MTTAEANLNKSLYLKAKELGITDKSSHFWSTAVAYGRSVGLSRQQAAQALIATAIHMKERAMDDEVNASECGDYKKCYSACPGKENCENFKAFVACCKEPLEGTQTIAYGKLASTTMFPERPL